MLLCRPLCALTRCPWPFVRHAKSFKHFIKREPLPTALQYANTGAFYLQAKTLFDAPPGAPHLLPFYSRVAASLAQVFPDVASALLRYLEEEFALLQV